MCRKAEVSHPVKMISDIFSFDNEATGQRELVIVIQVLKNIIFSMVNGERKTSKMFQKFIYSTLHVHIVLL